MRRLLALAALGATLAFFAPHADAQKAPLPKAAITDVAVAELPPEARETIALIRKKGPYPYAKDGVIFGNREGMLPAQKRSYYHEYTVRTPGSRTRGARRIITGAGGELYYTADHYTTFRRIRE